MIKKNVLELIDKWRVEADVVNAEIQVLKNAAEILHNDLLAHNIELWKAKSIRLQTCVMDLQQLVIDENLMSMCEIETANQVKP